ncbi:LacI family DNA-binding transcriptional regulator [Georgenia sunbinii]|uniref:LacI family DNA-binding transcriptional regulator n=1 Tax=Georgenia sunbinii TaxID=3117728 RepID=UPI002F25ED77
MSDVAARAGVSHQTVSRVLNTPELVRPATRERVLLAIEELGYRRNLAARALATNRTRLIGVVNPSVMRFGPSHTTMAIQDAARAAGYATISAGTEDAAASPHDTMDFFLNLAVEGLVVVAPTAEIAEATRGLTGSLPVVVIAAGLAAAPPVHVVAVDHERGARDATRHLIDLGHREIVHVAGPDNWFDARARVSGWHAELTDAGLPVPALVPGGWDASQGYQAGQQLLRRPTLPTAVFAANDQLALGMMRAFHEAGVRIPQDVAIVGYDDVSGSDFYHPPLTTVRQPFQEVGHKAIEVLLAAIDGDSPGEILTRPELVVRESSGGPR